MIGTTIRGTSLFLAAVAAQIGAAEVRPGEEPGLCDFLRIPTVDGHVEVWDAEEIGEHGLAIRTYEPGVGAPPIGVGDSGWICERATVEDAVEAIRRHVRERDGEGRGVESSGTQPTPSRPVGMRLAHVIPATIR